MKEKLNHQEIPHDKKTQLPYNEALSENLNYKKADQEQYYRSSSLVKNIENNDLIAVGGSWIFSDTLDLFLQVDYGAEQIQFFYDGVKNGLLRNKQNPDFIKHIDQIYPLVGQGIDLELFMHLVQYSMSFGKKFPDVQAMSIDQQMKRSQCYAPSSAPRLSDIMQKKLMMCAENSTLARKYFKDQGFDCFLINGGLLQDFQPDGENFGEAHSFLLFEKNGKEWIFDPTLPHKQHGFHFPRIIKIPDEISFLDFFKKKQCFFVQGEGSSCYYGNGGAQEVVFEKDILGPSQE